jgi:formylglycine-generating enzyme required for sulfatase activity
MLYECLSGRKPFDGNNATTILYKIVSEAPKPLEIEEIFGISPSIRDVLHRALAKDPAQRFASADELAKALRACKDPSWVGTVEEHTALIAKHRPDAAPVSRVPSEPTVKVASRPPEAGSRRSMVWFALGGVVLLVMGGLGWQLLASRLANKPAPPSSPIVTAAVKTPSRHPLGMVFAAIPAGSFPMGGGLGEADEKPIHEVTISRPFRLQTTPVTVGQFQAFVEQTGYRTDAEKIGKAWARDEQTGKWDEKKGIYWRHPGFTQEDSCPVICATWNDAQAFLEWLNHQNPGKGYRLPTEAEWEYACRAGGTGVRYGELEAIRRPMP